MRHLESRLSTPTSDDDNDNEGISTSPVFELLIMMICSLLSVIASQIDSLN